jgi:hypothetical protein
MQKTILARHREGASRRVQSLRLRLEKLERMMDD